MSRAYQSSATDVKQIRHADRKSRDRRGRLKGALREVMATPAGRFLLWSLLERAGVYASVYAPDDAAVGLGMAYRAGRQDYGHELLAAIIDANEDGYLLMQREAMDFQRAEDRETAAVHTETAEERER